MEDDDSRKRNTDCVYFLASPLTCKKGIECEYRHSEMARLNPRDCWYWLAGNCLNPACGFRHPPLDKDAEAPPSLPHDSSVASKTHVPCYFYFNGFCSRGERCLFSHGPHGNAASAIYVKKSPAIKDEVPLNDTRSAGNGTLSAPEAAHVNPSQVIPKAVPDAYLQPKEHSPENVVQQDQSAQVSVSHCEDAAVLKSPSLLQVEGFTQRRSHSHGCIDQISEEPLEDRWESSPGFDVLVDDKSGNSVYEEDQEYLLGIDNEQRQLNNHFLQYDFEDSVEYEPLNPAMEFQYEGRTYDSFNCLDDELIFNDVGTDAGCLNDGMLDSILSHKRKILSADLGMNDQRRVDLRDHLRMRRIIEGRSARRHDSSLSPRGAQARPTRHGTRPRVHGRLASKVVRHEIGSWRANVSLSSPATLRGWHRQHRHSESIRSRQHKENKLRQHLFSERLGKPTARERRYIQASTAFTGPRTFGQIRKAHSRVGQNGDFIRKARHSNRTASTDFEGPKSLTEILKDKRRLDSLSD
ncbi:hypothetical protein Tsubulata_037997 [Turnera subulata]|uniref:C3H1-type domain-containing protein n=1 Tax=Turnera subulata TaxID=218843 RepID=A0A9Q0GB46_9ROSI|nr:hypothetical protein Tsubulata_037997 [Turnera subulata]